MTTTTNPTSPVLPSAIEHIATDALVPYARNSRTHSPEQVAQLGRSMREFGFTNPVLIDEHNTLIAGHGRVMAAQSIGLAVVPAIRLTHLSDAQRRAYVIADNKLAEQAGWDMATLAREVEDLQALDFDVDLLGFGGDELAALLGEHGEAAGEPSGQGGDPDTVPEPAPDPVSVLGDVWVLGKHRVMCGDSTSSVAVGKLMDGKRAELVFTDPPYGIGYTPKASAGPGRQVTLARKAMAGKLIANDANAAEALRVTTAALALHHDAPSHFVCCDWRSLGTITGAMRSAGIEPKACIVWDKGGPYQHLDKFAKGHEFIVYAGPYGGQKTFATDVWKFPREFRDDHPTPKPTELVAHAVEAASSVGGIVFDAFAGSGSAVMAAEKTGRQARLMELDPKYVDVIIKRWQTYTGQQAVHEATGKTFAQLQAERVPASAAALPTA